MKATKTTKVYDITLEDLRRLTKDSKEGLTQAQIIARAISNYAITNGYAYCVSGIVGVGDKVTVDDSILTIKTITDKDIIFNDLTAITRNGRLAWRMEKVSK